MTEPFTSTGARSGHPSSSELAEFCAGRVSGAELERIAAHVAVCEACARQLTDAPADSLVQLARAVNESSGRRRAPDHAVQSLAETRVGSSSAAPDAGLQATSSVSADDVPVELRDHPRFEIIGELGRGGMGIVYRARHRMMNRDVALKVIHPKFTSHRQAVERFRQEVRASAKLKHPNIVTAFDAEQCGGLLVLVMEFIAGCSLAELVQNKGPMSPEAACEAIRQACAGLQHAHNQGLVHRDIKPQNLIRTDSGGIRVLDFGLARLEDHALVSQTARTEPNLTLIGAMLGTPDFMAPEQAMDSSTADARADVYSLGATLFYLLTGELPFAAEGGNELAAMMFRKLRWSEAARSRVPEALVPILERMTAVNPNERYRSAGEVASTLAALLRRPAVNASIVPAPPPVPGVVLPTENAPDRESGRESRPVVDQSVHRQTRSQRASHRYWISLACVVAAGIALSVSFVSSLWRGDDDAAIGSLQSPDVPGSGLKARESDVSRLPLRGAAGTRVLLVVSATDFQWSDIAPLRAAWQPAPGVLHLASWANPITNAQRAGQSASVDRLLSDARAEDYDVLIVAGGAGLMYLTERNGDHESIRSLISEMLTSSKPVGAIGAGPGVLASCGVLNGLSAAGHPLTHADVLERFHVQLLDQPVVRSDYIVTARDVNASAALVREIRTVLGAR